MIFESILYIDAANNNKTNGHAEADSANRGDTIRTAQCGVPLDNANSYQQKQQTELGHAIFSIDSS